MECYNTGEWQAKRCVIHNAKSEYNQSLSIAMAYLIEFAESVKGHFRRLSARDRVILFDEIEKQLLHEPLVETRNRKPLRPNPLAPWELRVGDLRVFYEVPEAEPGRVRILAIGEKRGNSLWIGGKEVQL